MLAVVRSTSNLLMQM